MMSQTSVSNFSHKMYKCTYCNREYPHHSSRRRHIIREHLDAAADESLPRKRKLEKDEESSLATDTSSTADLKEWEHKHEKQNESDIEGMDTDDSSGEIDSDESYSELESEKESDDDIETVTWNRIFDVALSKLKTSNPQLEVANFLNELNLVSITIPEVMRLVNNTIEQGNALKRSPLYVSLKKIENKLVREGYQQWEAKKLAMEKRKWFIRERLLERCENDMDNKESEGESDEEGGE